jgi:hypothetical protein
MNLRRLLCIAALATGLSYLAWAGVKITGSAPATVLPNSLQIQGNLTVSNSATVGDSLTVNGTASLMPNQTASSGASVMTRDLGDSRYLNRETTYEWWEEFFDAGRWTVSAASGTHGPSSTGIGFWSLYAMLATNRAIALVGAQHGQDGTRGAVNLAGATLTLTMRFRIVSTTNTAMFCGFSQGDVSSIPFNRFVGVWYDSSLHTNAWAVSRDGGTTNSIPLTTSLTAWNTYVFSITTNTATVSVNGSVVGSLAVPIAGTVGQTVWLKALDAERRELLIDWYGFRGTR